MSEKYIELNNIFINFESINSTCETEKCIDLNQKENLKIYQLELKLCSTLYILYNTESTQKKELCDLSELSCNFETQKTILNLESLFEKEFIFYTNEFNFSIYRFLQIYNSIKNLHTNLNFNYKFEYKNLHQISSDIFVLNKLSNHTINFNYVYGFFYLPEKNLFCTLQEKYDYINIPTNIEFIDFLNIFLQILFSIQLAYEYCEYTHYNLTIDKIKIIKKDSIHTLKYMFKNEPVYLQCKYIVKITNSKYSYFNYNKVKYYFSGCNNYGIKSESNNLIDSYKLLFSFIDVCNTHNNIECIKNCNYLIQYFYNNLNIPQSIQKIKKMNYYFEKIPGKDTSGYIDYILQIYKPNFIRSNIEYTLIEYNSIFRGLYSSDSQILLNIDNTNYKFENLNTDFTQIGLFYDYYLYNKKKLNNTNITVLHINLKLEIEKNKNTIDTLLQKLSFPYYSDVYNLIDYNFLEALQEFCYNILQIFILYKTNIYLYNIYCNICNICKIYKLPNEISIEIVNLYNVLLEGSQKLINITSFSNNLNLENKHILKKYIIQNSKFKFYFNNLVIFNTIIKTHLYN